MREVQVPSSDLFCMRGVGHKQYGCGGSSQSCEQN